jgi:BNR repeat-like domain
MGRGIWRTVAALGVLWMARGSAPERRPAGEHAIEIPMSGHSPFAGCAPSPQIGSVVMNSAVEPFVTADPNRPDHLVGVWQQDRWTNGGANGTLSAVTRDGGWNWTVTTPPFTQCTGGVWDRASDPWVSIAPDGTVHQIALGLNRVGASNQSNSVLVTRSTDGGLTWSNLTTLIQDTDGGDDKETITADSGDARFVYAVWDRPNGNNRQPTLFSRTTDGGATWEPARVIYDPGANAYTTGNIIVVLPGGTLVDLLSLYQATGISVAVIRSQDRGVTWSAPVVVSANQSVGTLDLKTHTTVRVGSGLPAIAVDRNSGALYTTWQDARFTGGRYDGIALSKSTDGGLTWSVPQQVNQAPDFQAFTPALAVAGDGRVAVTYYDFRNDTADAGVLLTNRWQATSADGGGSWVETPVGATFDLLKGPALAGGALFVGDYQGLAASARAFVSFSSAATGTTAIWAAPVKVRP